MPFQHRSHSDGSEWTFKSTTCIRTTKFLMKCTSVFVPRWSSCPWMNPAAWCCHEIARHSPKSRLRGLSNGAGSPLGKLAQFPQAPIPRPWLPGEHWASACLGLCASGLLTPGLSGGFLNSPSGWCLLLTQMPLALARLGSDLAPLYPGIRLRLASGVGGLENGTNFFH